MSWDLDTIGTGKDSGATKPFRFSLCEGRYLTAGEVSRPCYHPPKVGGGHNAPFVFSPGHNTFLPPGLSIDGDGILKGDDPALLTKLDEGLPLCVRQVDVERCKTIKFGEKTKNVEDNIAKAIDNGSGPPKKGMGGARVAILGLGLGGAAVLAASALQVTEEGAAGGSGGMTYVDSQGIVCFYNAGGVLSNCSGQIVVNITNKIAAGSTIRLQGSFWGGNRTTTSSPPGSINFFLTGGAGQSCPGPLTSLALLNLSESSSTVIASVGGISIPVNCR